MDLEHKAIASGVTVKDSSRGEVEAVVARINVPDHDGDVFLPGAFGTQPVKVSAFNHRSWPERGGEMPVGKGTLRERGEEVRASLRFFMDTESGREHFAHVREMGDLQEWSYGWPPGREERAELTDEQRAQGIRRAIKKVPVVEVSPVMMAASIGTRTVSVKAALAEGRAELRRAELLLDEWRHRPRRNPVFPQDVETVKLAGFAAAVAHMLASYPRHPHPPDVKWFRPNGKESAFMIPGRHETHVSLDRNGPELVASILHEARHHAQDAYGDLEAAGAEAEARSFAKRWERAVLAAGKWTSCDHHRVHAARKARPPFRGQFRGQYRRHDVVLAAGRAYLFDRFRRNAWTTIA